MNLETLQIPAFISILIALASFVFFPVVAMAKSSNSPDGGVCDLPPVIEIEGSDATLSGYEPPPLDGRTADNIRTATFAMG